MHQENNETTETPINETPTASSAIPRLISARCVDGDEDDPRVSIYHGADGRVLWGPAAEAAAREARDAELQAISVLVGPEEAADGGDLGLGLIASDLEAKIAEIEARNEEMAASVAAAEASIASEIAREARAKVRIAELETRSAELTASNDAERTRQIELRKEIGQASVRAAEAETKYRMAQLEAACPDLTPEEREAFVELAREAPALFGPLLKQRASLKFGARTRGDAE